MERECSIASVRGRLFGLLLGAAAVLTMTAPEVTPANAGAAARVLVMGAHGRVTTRVDRFLGPQPFTPRPPREAVFEARASVSEARASRPTKQRTVRSELTRLYRSGQIDQADYQRYSASFNSALNAG